MNILIHNYFQYIHSELQLPCAKVSASLKPYSCLFTTIWWRQLYLLHQFVQHYMICLWDWYTQTKQVACSHIGYFKITVMCLVNHCENLKCYSTLNSLVAHILHSYNLKTMSGLCPKQSIHVFGLHSYWAPVTVYHSHTSQDQIIWCCQIWRGCNQAQLLEYP